MTQEEINQLQRKTLEQFKSGKSLFVKGGAFAPMLKQLLEAAPNPSKTKNPDAKPKDTKVSIQQITSMLDEAHTNL